MDRITDVGQLAADFSAAGPGGVVLATIHNDHWAPATEPVTRAFMIGGGYADVVLRSAGDAVRVLSNIEQLNALTRRPDGGLKLYRRFDHSVAPDVAAQDQADKAHDQAQAHAQAQADIQAAAQAEAVARAEAAAAQAAASAAQADKAKTDAAAQQQGRKHGR